MRVVRIMWDTLAPLFFSAGLLARALTLLRPSLAFFQPLGEQDRAARSFDRPEAAAWLRSLNSTILGYICLAIPPSGLPSV